MRPSDELEAALIDTVDWAREFLACEVEGQYTSDAALHLALFVMAQAPQPVALETRPHHTEVQ